MITTGGALRASRRSIAARTAVCALAALAFAACGSPAEQSAKEEPPSVSLNAEEVDLPRCGPTEPQPLPVDALDDEPRASCNLEGAEVVFPNDVRATVPAILESSNLEPVQHKGSYSLHNLGVYGVVAVTEIPGGKQQYWGSPETVEKVRKGYPP